MPYLTDYELGLILNWVKHPNDRISFSQVCKKWWLEESWNRSSIRVLKLDRLPRLLARFPNIVTFQTSGSISNANLELLAHRCPKLEVLDLTAPWDGPAAKVCPQGLCTLANRCPRLSKVLLRRRYCCWIPCCFVEDCDDVSKYPDCSIQSIVSFVPLAGNLKHLDLGLCERVTDETLEAIGSSNCSISVLNLESCGITDSGLRFLTSGSCSKTIKVLILNECRDITDYGVSLLEKLCVLEELSLAYCKEVTKVGILVISSIRTLRKLNIAWGPRVTDDTIIALAERTLEPNGSCCSITVLNLENCHLISDRGLRFLTNDSCSKTIKELVLGSCNRISDVGVLLLQKMRVLEELSLACCRQVTEVGLMAISSIRTLRKLSFAWGPKVTDNIIFALAENCLNLEMLDLRGNIFVTRVGIRAFLGHKCLEVLDLRYARLHVEESDLKDLAMACPSLKVLSDEGARRQKVVA